MQNNLFTKKAPLPQESFLYQTERMLDTIIARIERQNLQDLGIQVPLSPEILFRFRHKKDTKESQVLEYNPKAEDYQNYGYMPNLTLSYAKSTYTTGWYLDWLKIQCSVPKLLFDSSYFMNDASDLDTFTQSLSEKLREIGIGIRPSQISKLSISSFSIAYNILLPPRYGKPVGFLKKVSLLDKAKNIRKVLNTEYDEEAEGLAVRSFSQNTGFRMYDKGSQIINEARTPRERELKELILTDKIPSSILRLEKVYQRKASVKSAVNRFTKRPLKQDVVLHQLFNDGLCKDGLVDMTDKLGKTVNLIAADLGYDYQQLPIEAIWQVARDAGLSGQEVAFFSMYAIAVGQMGVKNALTQYDRIYGRKGQKHRTKFVNQISKVLEKADLKGFMLIDLFAVIKRQLVDFKVYKTVQQAQEVLDVAIAADGTGTFRGNKPNGKHEVLGLFGDIEAPSPSLN